MQKEIELKIIEMYEKEIPSKQIMLDLQVTYNNVANTLRKYGIKRRDRSQFFSLRKQREDSRRDEKLECLGRGRFTNIKNGAIFRSLPFEIDMDYIWELYESQNRKCKLTGLDIHFKSELYGYKDNTASLDRIDSSKGYIEGNLQWVHPDINLMKSDMDQNSFIDFCIKISNHQENSY